MTSLLSEKDNQVSYSAQLNKRHGKYLQFFIGFTCRNPTSQAQPTTQKNQRVLLGYVQLDPA